MAFDSKQLKMRLLQIGARQLDLALALKVPSTTLGSWIRGQHPAPADLPEKIEAALQSMEANQP